MKLLVEEVEVDTAAVAEVQEVDIAETLLEVTLVVLVLEDIVELLLEVDMVKNAKVGSVVDTVEMKVVHLVLLVVRKVGTKEKENLLEIDLLALEVGSVVDTVEMTVVHLVLLVVKADMTDLLAEMLDIMHTQTEVNKKIPMNHGDFFIFEKIKLFL